MPQNNRVRGRESERENLNRKTQKIMATKRQQNTWSLFDRWDRDRDARKSLAAKDMSSWKTLFFLCVCVCVCVCVFTLKCLIYNANLQHQVVGRHTQPLKWRKLSKCAHFFSSITWDDLQCMQLFCGFSEATTSVPYRTEKQHQII